MYKAMMSIWSLLEGKYVETQLTKMGNVQHDKQYKDSTAPWERLPTGGF
jgi:hypothetical protein